MRPRTCASLVFTCLLFSSATFAQTNNFSDTSKNKFTIEPPLGAPSVGEKLKFDVSWLGIPIGIGELEVREKVMVRGREAFHVIATARTNNFLSNIFPVTDEIHSFIDAETMYSLEFRKSLEEGRYRNEEKTEFSPESRTHDLVSAFYWFRLQPVAPGQNIKTVVSSRSKEREVEFRVLQSMNKELKGSRVVPVLEVEPKTELKEVLYKRGRVWIYFSMDSRRTPVWVTIQTHFGRVVGVLTG